MSKPTIACCVIALNEEDNIREWYRSIEGCFDQYVFVDTGSTDKTVEIAEELGLEVYHFEWVNDFAAARNFSFSKATTDYIFWCDLDDSLNNAEKFNLWKESCLGLGDYVTARYNYSFNGEGKPACQFIRERIVKNNVGFKWEYFVHEGIKPICELNDMKLDNAETWTIDHRRSAEDIKNDKGRNLALFEKNASKGKMDPRMMYYWGKELFDNQKYFDAAVKLGDALKETSLEAHDRVLAMQYIGYCYIHLGQFDKAIDISLTGLHVDPNRAEFFCNIGDAWIKKNAIVNSIPYFEAAQNCVMQNQQGMGAAIFHAEMCYGPYPRNQLARAWYHLGHLDKALEVAQGTQDKYKDGESKLLIAEFQKHKIAISSYIGAAETDDIVFTTPARTAYTFDKEIQQQRAMGGSETALIEMSEWIHKLSGKPVKVFNMRETAKTIDGVEWLPASKVHDYMSEKKPYFHVAWRHNHKLTNAPTFLWCHDLFTPGSENVDNYLKHLCLTPFHKRYTMATKGIPGDKIWVTRNGIDPHKFKPIEGEKDPFKFVFSSSPDRGLDRTILILDKVQKEYPELKLHIYYGWEHLKGSHLQGLAEKLEKMKDERDWIVYHGATDQSKLYDEFRSAAYCLQPSDWIETSKISALEQAFCGVYQITRSVGGVVDTLDPFVKEGSAELVHSNCQSDKEYQLYTDVTLEAIQEEKYKNTTKEDIGKYTWESVAREWLDNLPKFF